jgi:hypothetical protein
MDHRLAGFDEERMHQHVVLAMADGKRGRADCR